MLKTYFCDRIRFEVKKIRTNKSKKIGFLAALSILVGSVVGIGIFFKNGTVGRGVSHDGTGWIFAWIIGGIISLGTAVAFSEIGRIKSEKISGLSSWAATTFGKRIGHFVAINFPVVYLSLDTVVISYFTMDFFFAAIGVQMDPRVAILTNMSLGLLLLFFLLMIKRISIKTTGIIQTVTTFLKFLPLIVGVFAGIIVRAMGTEGVNNAFVTGPWISDSGTTRVLRVFAVLPAVLFAYDAFLNVASMTNKVKDGERRMPFIIGIGMLVITILYSMVGLSSVITDQTSIGGMVGLLAKGNAQLTKALSFTVNILIFVSAFGVTNGLTAVLNRDVQNLYNSGIWFGSPKLKARFGERGALFYIIGFMMFWFIPLLVLSQVFATDSLLDGLSNYPTLVFFVVYGMIVVGYWFKRKKLTTIKKINNKFFWVTSVISVAGIGISTLFWIFSQLYEITNESVSGIGWGGSNANNFTFSPLVPLLVAIPYVLLMFGSHFLNIYLAKKYEKRDVLELVASQIQKE